MGGTRGADDQREAAASRRLRKLLQNIDDTISLIDADGNLVETSGLYKPILGYPAEFWASRSIFDLLHPDDALRVLGMRDMVLADPATTVGGEFAVRAADGQYQPLMVHAVNRLDDPDVQAIVITSRNIAVEKALMADLARARDEALAEVELRTRLIATVSHELRNPLHALAGMAELLATADLPAGSLAMVSTLRRQLDGLTVVVDDLLESSRLGAGAVALTLASTPLRPLVDDVVAVGRLGVRSAEVVVAGEVADDVPAEIVTDAARLRQVLLNLVSNGVKFTPAGRVDVRVRLLGATHLAIDVADTGVGVPAAEQGRVFDAFTTGSTAGVAAGAGLGLTIVRQLAELLGGTVELASQVGAGTTVTVVLPRAPIAADDPNAADAPNSTATTDALGASMALVPARVPAGRGATVLVVEDDPVNQQLAVGQLARLGFDAVVVGSGEAALELVAGRTVRIDLVLMDMQLPGIDGLETARRLRALEPSVHGPVVMVGVTASALSVGEAVAAGLDDVVYKPLGLAGMAAVVSRWLGRPASLGERSPVDPAALDRLAIDLGAPAAVIQLVHTYLAELQGRRAACATAAACADLPAAHRAAHVLKSSSLLLGAVPLGRACARMEAVGHADELEVAAGEVAALSVETARWLQEWLSEQSA